MRKYVNLIVLFISLATFASGLTQLIMPSFVLKFVGGELTATTEHFFAIIGMFMTLFGGLMIQTVYSHETGYAPIVWSAIQKMGASIAVFIGILKGLFALQAGAIAVFDMASGIVFLYYLKVRKTELHKLNE